MRFVHLRWLLPLGFAGSVMADPVSSAIYAIESAGRELDGRSELLMLTMLIVLGAIATIAGSYWQLVGAYPDGGGSAEAAGDTFGVGWTFVPLGALVVDFVLTIAVSIAAASAAIIAWKPALAPWHLLVGLGLLVFVTGMVVLGVRGRLVFAAMTLAFLVSAVVVVTGSVDSGNVIASGVDGGIGDIPDGDHESMPSILLVLLAMSGAMALATGVEAPSSAIGELDVGSRMRRRIGRATLVATVIVVTAVTVSMVWLVGHADQRSTDTLLAAAVRDAVGDGARFTAFQLTSALLLLAAASSSLQAGPGLIRALSGAVEGSATSVLPGWAGRSTPEGVPWVAVLGFAAVSGCVLAAAGADEQTLVVFYATAVFLGFAFGIAAMARRNLHAGSVGAFMVNVVGLVVTLLTLLASALRIWPLVSIAAALVVAALLVISWRARGRPALRIAAADD